MELDSAPQRPRLTIGGIFLGILGIGAGLGILRALAVAKHDPGLLVDTAMYFGGFAIVGAGIGTFFGGPYRWAIILVVIAMVWALVTH